MSVGAFTIDSAEELYAAAGCSFYWSALPRRVRVAREASFQSMEGADRARLLKLVGVLRDQFWIAPRDWAPWASLSATEARPGHFAKLSLDAFLDAKPEERPRVYLDSLKETAEQMRVRRFGVKKGLLMAYAAGAGGLIAFMDVLSLHPGYRAVAHDFGNLALVKGVAGHFSYLATGYFKDRLISAASRRFLEGRSLTPGERAGFNLVMLMVRLGAADGLIKVGDHLHEVLMASTGGDGAQALAAAGPGASVSEVVLQSTPSQIPSHLLERALRLHADGGEHWLENLKAMEEMGQEMTPEMVEWTAAQLERLLLAEQKTLQFALALYAAHHADESGFGALARRASLDLLDAVPAPFARKRTFQWYLKRRVEMYSENGLGVTDALRSLHLKDSWAEQYLRASAGQREHMLLEAPPPPAAFRRAAAQTDSFRDAGWIQRRYRDARATTSEVLEWVRRDLATAAGAAMAWLDRIPARLEADLRKRHLVSVPVTAVEPVGRRPRAVSSRVAEAPGEPVAPRFTRPRG